MIKRFFELDGWDNTRYTCLGQFYNWEDFSGHLGKKDGYDRVKGYVVLRTRYDMEVAILNFILAFDLAVANTYF